MSLFAQESIRLADEMQRRAAELMRQHGIDSREAFLEIGKVMLMQGVTFIGKSYDLPHTAALPVGYHALDEFNRIIESMN